MKKYKTELCVLTFLLIAVYLLTAFIQLTFDFSQWSENTRIVVCCCWFFTVFTYLAAISNWEAKN